MKGLRIPFSKARRDSKHAGDNISSERKEGWGFFSSPPPLQPLACSLLLVLVSLGSALLAGWRGTVIYSTTSPEMQALFKKANVLERPGGLVWSRVWETFCTGSSSKYFWPCRPYGFWGYYSTLPLLHTTNQRQNIH